MAEESIAIPSPPPPENQSISHGFPPPPSGPSSVRRRPRVPRLSCDCGISAERVMQFSEGKNKNNWFFQCPHWKERGSPACRVFVWEKHLQEYTNEVAKHAIEMVNYHISKTAEAEASFKMANTLACVNHEKARSMSRKLARRTDMMVKGFSVHGFLLVGCIAALFRVYLNGN